MTCAASPTIRNYLATADPVAVTIDRQVVRYMLRVRESVDATINLPSDPAALFTLKAGEVLSEERLALRNEVELRVSVTAGSTVEVWTWDG